MERSQGVFSGRCQKTEHSLGSLCMGRAISDGLSCFFLLLFFLLWLVGFLRKQVVRRESRDWVFVAASILCTITGISYITVGLWDILVDNDLTTSVWVGYVVWGLTWIFLSIALVTPKTDSMRIVIFLWLVSFSILDSGINVLVLVKTHTIGVLDVVSWPINFLLLFCACRVFIQLVSKTAPCDNLSEPLLDGKDDTSRSGLDKSNFFSRLTFSWLNPLLRKGYSKPLAFEDIPSLASEDEAFIAYREFSYAWDSLLKKKRSDDSNLVIKALAKVYTNEMIVIGIYAFLRTLSVVVAPLLLYGFVQYSTQGGTLYDGMALVGYLVVVKVVESLSQRHCFFNARRTGMRMRSALMVAVYQKQLKLSSISRTRHSTGEIVNYIAVDAYRMGEFPFWFHCMWSFVVQLFLAIAVLFGTVGLGALPGLIPLFICALLNVPFAKMLQNCQYKFMISQDERLRATSEVLNNMKIIKLQAWEEKFKNLIESLREGEFKWLAKAQLMKAAGTGLYWMSPTIISSVVFLGCALTKSAPLNASTIFTVLVTLRSMAEPVRMIPESLSMMIQVKVSLDRLGVFLLDDELNGETLTRSLSPESNFSVRMNAGFFSWNRESAASTLRDISFEVRRGDRIAICGPVGAGKSSLLYAILGEIPKISGTVDVFGSIAYVSQTSWIQSGTLRDNILNGKQMDDTRYNMAIKACALDKDIDGFPHGDLTEIGQRGLNMSGGQKQRIQLARAVYNDADIYLLDDPFSAVDAHTAAILFNECVMAALATKTVILVTHQVEFLAEVDKILVMEGGQITQSGNYEDLMKVGTAFEQLVNAHNNAMTTANPGNNRIKEECENIGTDQSAQFGQSYSKKEDSEIEISTKGMPGIQLTENEEKEIGDIGWKSFYDYITVSRGIGFLGLCIFSQSAFVLLQVASTYWLAIAEEIPQISTVVLVGVYTIISTSSTLFVYLRSYFAAHLGLKASKAFFSCFTNSVFRAPMLFFDSTPIGRILTRASSDLSVIDFDIPYSAAFVIAAAIEMASTICIMASVTWPVLIVAILAMIAVKYVQGYNLASAREMVRINGMTKAPVMNYAAETSLGVVTIRAFSMTERFFHNYLNLIDTDARLFFYSNAIMEWLVIRVEVLQNFTLFTAALLLVLLPQGTVAPGFVGLSLSYALALTGAQVFMTRWYCNLTNYIISVERIKQMMHIPAEPQAIIDDKRPPASWPSLGRIDLQDLKIKYRPNAPLVLKGITCRFKEGSRVGVVGRTGSGKTTLISALFRLVDPTSGRILIDGMDICSIGLRNLRLKLSIIPQEPTLFRGTVRTNLDPLGLYSDQQIWEAIEKCQLKATIRSLPNLLDSRVSDEGENWSSGQRQLLCLGRVLLKRNKILVLDEATASIDSATDAILQSVIRQEFKNCTVITVAHRVPTVIDSDMVMVLSYGKLVEYDEPSKLIESDSSFSKLVVDYWSSYKKSSHSNS